MPDNVTPLRQLEPVLDPDAPKTPDRDTESPGYRQMPHNMRAEQALLGAILINNRALEKVNEFLRAEHFFIPAHQRIYETIEKLAERGIVANPITLAPHVENDKDLEPVGGSGYLTDLAGQVVSIVNAEDFGRTVFEHFQRRQLIDMGEDVVNIAYRHDADHPPHKQIEDAEAQLFKLAENGDFRGGFQAWGDSMTAAIAMAEKAYKADGNVSGLTTGLRDLDAKLGGLQRSDLLILAGRPSMGKSSLAMNIAYKAAKAYLNGDHDRGARTAVFSLEMSAEQLALRILSDVTSIPSEKIRRGEISDHDFTKFATASQELAKLPLYIDDTPALTIAAIRTRARRLQRQHGLDLILIDYLQLISGSSKSSQANRVQEVSEISRGLKTLAKELDVPVIALSQLSRALEQRENKRPQLSDLRESGSIEQDADVVMFIYREEYYLSREEPAQKPEEGPEKFADRYQGWVEKLEKAQNVAECIVGKQRHGPIGTVELYFDGEFTRFTDLDRDHG